MRFPKFHFKPQSLSNCNYIGHYDQTRQMLYAQVEIPKSERPSAEVIKALLSVYVCKSMIVDDEPTDWVCHLPMSYTYVGSSPTHTAYLLCLSSRHISIAMQRLEQEGI